MNFSEKAMNRFNSYIKKQKNGCWIFDKPSPRYVQLMLDGKIYSAHRVSYVINKGKIKNGLMVCHTCDNPKCVNPDHLFLGTALDNNRDRDSKGKNFNKNKTHCKHGHELKEGSFYFYKNGNTRYCLECRRINDKNRTRNIDEKAHKKYLKEQNDRYYKNKYLSGGESFKL